MIESSLNKTKKHRKISSSTQKDDISYDNSIRPNSFKDIIGRANEKKTLEGMIKGARNRKEPVDHILFYGPPGLGKTTFAMAIANEIGGSLRITSGPAIERAGDLAAILTNLKPNDVLFIDEIHRIPRVVEEVLYPAMEDRVLDIVMGKGPSAKTIRLNIEPFTLVGATTQVGKISSPLRDRFGLILRLDYFDDADLVEILARAQTLWDLKSDIEVLRAIAKRSRGTARVALRILRRVRDFSKDNIITLKEANEVFSLLGIDELGLEQLDKKIISVIYSSFNGGPVGLSTLAAIVSEDVDTLSEVYEPYLMKCGLLHRTSRGRVLTESGIRKAIEILGLKSII